MNRLSLFLKSTIVSLILFSFLSCGNSESEKCSEVERYLDKQENDSAINLFKTINYSELYDDDSKNTYALLRTRVDYLEGYEQESDTISVSSISSARMTIRKLPNVIIISQSIIMTKGKLRRLFGASVKRIIMRSRRMI